MVLAGVLAVAFAGAAFVAAPHLREEAPRMTKFEFPPPEKGNLEQRFGPPAVSPDGRRVAFLAVVDGKPDALGSGSRFAQRAPAAGNGGRSQPLLEPGQPPTGVLHVR